MTMRMENFGATFRQKDGTLRSLSSPALAKKRQLATQTLLRATSENRLDLVRVCALQQDSELDGYRAYNQHGANATKIVNSSYHLLPEECKRLHTQLRELPQLLNAAERIRARSPGGDQERGTGPRPGLRGEVVLRKAPGTKHVSMAPQTAGKFGGNTGGVPDFEGTGKVTSKGLRYAEEPKKFTVGDRVMVRDSELLAWRSGTVVSLCPTKVKRDGQTVGHAFKMIEFESLALPCVSGHSAAHAGSPVIAEIPYGEHAEIAGDAVGDFMKVRWAGREVWVDRRDATQKPFAKQSTMRATVSLGDLGGSSETRNVFAMQAGGSSSSSATGAPVAEEPPLSPKTIRGKELAYRTAMGRFTDIVSHPDKGRDAIYKNPGLLRTQPELMRHTMPSIAGALRSEELALRAVTKNPKLLNVDSAKFKNVIPVLNVILGSEKEAAYAIAARPELLEIERGQQFKETVQMVADCVSSMNDAVWLVVQTIVPPSIQFSARAHSAEALVGEYTRINGLRVCDRPVYKKPASTLTAQFGAKAMDLYFVYTSGAGASGESAWTVTPDFDPSQARRPSKSRKQPISKAIARAAWESNSPDQVPKGSWELRLGCTYTDPPTDWTVDDHVKVADAKAPRTRPLLLCPPSLVRGSFDLLSEALGIFWRKPTSDGRPMRSARLVGCLRRGDKVHGGGNWVVQSLGDFTLKNKYTCLRLPFTSPSSTVLSLQAWEPLLVYMLYLGPEPRVEREDGEQDEQTEEEVAALEAERQARDALLEKEGWWKLPRDAIKPPLLSPPPPVPGSEEPVDEENSKPTEVPEFAEIFVRSYPRGSCQVPTPRGSYGPPLVFSRPLLAGTAGRGGRSCELVKAQPGEDIFFSPRGAQDAAADGDADAGADEEEPPMPTLKGAGDLGYAGYSFFRQGIEETAWGTDEVQLRIDTADAAKVVVAFFPVPPEELLALPVVDEEAAPADPAEEGAQEAPTPQKPQLPSWVQEEGWKRYNPRLSPTILTRKGDLIAADRCRIREFENEIITVKGPGPEMTCVVFALKVGSERKNIKHDLLYTHPGILGVESHLELLMRRLRVELGEELARHTLMQRAEEWAQVCQVFGPAEIEAWIKKRKIESFDRVLLAPDLWARAPPEIAERLPETDRPLHRTLSVTIVSALGLGNVYNDSHSFWCSCLLESKHEPMTGKTVFRTKLQNSHAPEWDETHQITKWQGESLIFFVYDQTHETPSSGTFIEPRHGPKLGKIVVKSDQFFPNGFDGEVPLIVGHATNGPSGAVLRIRIHAVEGARKLIERQPEIASVSTPWFAERCRALKQGLDGNSAALQVIKKRPDLLLASESALFAHALGVLKGIFERPRAQRIALQHPELLTMGRQLEAIFARLKSLYPQVAVERLRNATEGEWILWRSNLSQPEEVIAKWLGRIAAEERHLTCGDRVRNFGRKSSVENSTK
eukprot:TRINITY_DN16881_c0_g1_i1.p1 TRINITY_DN16881_c0_g1~~TRINITY_DN16881_c0_g1_i1.p1  ORF type:complete len:1441 (+),score=180.78 TRINITY_DN16881_c0_g1_i1:74-4396(+)